MRFFYLSDAYIHEREISLDASPALRIEARLLRIHV